MRLLHVALLEGCRTDRPRPEQAAQAWPSPERSNGAGPASRTSRAMGGARSGQAGARSDGTRPMQTLLLARRGPFFRLSNTGADIPYPPPGIFSVQTIHVGIPADVRIWLRPSV